MPSRYWRTFDYIKVSQKFANILFTFGNNSGSSWCFVEVMKRTNRSRLSHAELTWYFLKDALRICIFSLNQGLAFYEFRLTWTFLIVEVLATCAKFRHLYSYPTVIKCTFAFRAKSVFGCFRVVTALWSS